MAISGSREISPIDLDIMCYIYRENKKGVITDLANIQEAYKDKLSADEVKKMMNSLWGIYLDTYTVLTPENTEKKMYVIFDTALEFIEWANTKFFEEDE